MYQATLTNGFFSKFNEETKLLFLQCSQYSPFDEVFFFLSDSFTLFQPLQV